jgi:hypothetical protein
LLTDRDVVGNTFAAFGLAWHVTSDRPSRTAGAASD